MCHVGRLAVAGEVTCERKRPNHMSSRSIAQSSRGSGYEQELGCSQLLSRGAEAVGGRDETTAMERDHQRHVDGATARAAQAESDGVPWVASRNRPAGGASAFAQKEAPDAGRATPLLLGPGGAIERR